MNRRTILLALAIGGGGSAYFVPWQGKDVAALAANANELYAVRSGDLRITIVENGTMVAKESQKVNTKHRNESKILMLIEEGKEVTEGEIVCKLDSAPLTQQVETIQLEILQTEANLKTARTELEIATVETAAAVDKAKAALDKSKKELEKYRDDEATIERRKLEVALKDAETEFNKKKKNTDDSAKLLEQNYIKKSELEDHRIAFERAVVQKDSAEAQLRMFDKYTFPMHMTDLETKVSDATRDVDTAQKRGESTMGQKTVAVQQMEKRLKVQNDQLKERQTDLENMTMKAPCPGIVVYGNPHEPWYRERIKVGQSVYGGMTLLTIPDLRIMQVKVQVHEADISKLKTGLVAGVTADSYPGLQLEGEVTKIATVANGNNEWGGSSAEVKKFDVEVTLKSPGVPLRPGISAKVEIHIETRENVLYVPLQSVFAEDGEQFCHVQPKDSAPEKRSIKLGKSNDNFMEILEGLLPGESVLLYNPLLPEGGDSKAKKAPEEKKEPAKEKEATPPGPGPKAGA